MTNELTEKEQKTLAQIYKYKNDWPALGKMYKLLMLLGGIILTFATYNYVAPHFGWRSTGDKDGFVIGFGLLVFGSFQMQINNLYNIILKLDKNKK